MRRLCMIVGLSLGLAASGCARDPAAKRADVQGRWRAVTAERNGAPAPDLVGHELTFTGDRFRITSNGRLLFGGPYTIDPSARPSRIDLRQEEGDTLRGTWRGIYRLRRRRAGDRGQRAGHEQAGARPLLDVAGLRLRAGAVRAQLRRMGRRATGRPSSLPLRSPRLRVSFPTADPVRAARRRAPGAPAARPSPRARRPCRSGRGGEFRPCGGIAQRPHRAGHLGDLACTLRHASRPWRTAPDLVHAAF